MNENKNQQADRIRRYAHLIEQQTGKAVRPFRSDGYVNMMNRYGTSKDSSEHYHFSPEPDVPDDTLAMFYEGNGLFAKVIDAPAEEAIKRGFKLKDVSDEAVENFYSEALDELDWEEVAMTGIKWARLFGGAIAVMLVNDGKGLEEPLDWKRIKSIDDIRVYDRSVIQLDYSSMYNYDPRNPFSTRGSRLGMPEYYFVNSRYGSFKVHESRCLVFQNGVLPENASNTIYQFWGIPEYIRIHRALRDTELAHSCAPKMLDRSVQPVYKMQDLSALLATEEGESQVLKRLQVIDMARGMLNSLVIDSEGEDYDFKTFQFSGVADVIDATCNLLSALTNIPQTVLFGRSPAGMNSTGESDLENWYSYVGRIQKRMLKSNLRYLLSVIFQAGLYTGEVDEVPKIKIEFNPLKTTTESEQANLDSQRASTALIKAQTAQVYRDMEVLDSTEIRKKLADSGEFDVETILDEYENEEELMAAYTEQEAENPNAAPLPTEEGGYTAEVDVEKHEAKTGSEGSTPANAPAATKLPQDMSSEEKEDIINKDAAQFGVGVLVVKDGLVLCGTRQGESGHGLICGPGGHVENGETPEQAAYRETEEEFGISPKELIPVETMPVEPESGLRSCLYLCTEFEGEPDCVDHEIAEPKFRSMDELELLKPSLFPPFADSLSIIKEVLAEPDNEDGGPGSGNFGHKGRPGEVGGSAESHKLGGETNGSLLQKAVDVFKSGKQGTQYTVQANGKVSKKEKYEIYKVSDGYYVVGKNGNSFLEKSEEKMLERIGVSGFHLVKDKVMFEQFDIQTGDPGTESADRFVADYESMKDARTKLEAGEKKPETISDDDAKKYADALNSKSSSKIKKLAETDEKFKAVADNVAAYTQGFYIMQRKSYEIAANGEYTPKKDAVIGEHITRGMLSCKDMYNGQNLSVSSSGVVEGMTYLTRAIENAEPFDGELLRVTSATGLYKTADSGAQSVYVPPRVGDVLDITSPTSFTKSEKVIEQIAKGKSGDVIYYSVESGARAVDVTKLSPYKQEELLTCGRFEVVEVSSEPYTTKFNNVDRLTPETVENLKKHRNATVTDGYIEYPMLVTRIKLRQKDTVKQDSDDDTVIHYMPDDCEERMVVEATVSKVNTPENISDGTKKTLDFSPEKVTITSKGLSQDGAPKGNKNAEGPHRRNHLSEADKRSYTKRIVGQTTSDGIKVTKFSDHAYDRVAQRNVSKAQIEQMIHSENIVPDKQFPDRNCYDIKGKRLVLNKKTGEIVTVEKRRQNK